MFGYKNNPIYVANIVPVNRMFSVAQSGQHPAHPASQAQQSDAHRRHDASPTRPSGQDHGLRLAR